MNRQFQKPNVNQLMRAKPGEIFDLKTTIRLDKYLAFKITPLQCRKKLARIEPYSECAF